MQCVCDVCGKLFNDPYDCKAHEEKCKEVEDMIFDEVEAQEARKVDFTNRMNHLRNVAQAKAKKEAEAKAKVENHRAELEAKICELSPRIPALLGLVNEAIRLGVLKPLNCLHGSGLVGRAPNFFCDGVNHKIGFYQLNPYNKINMYPIGIGIRAGGGEGPVDLCVTSDGVVQGRDTKENSKEVASSSVRIKDLETFLSTFDEFEEKFYETIDNLEV